MEQGPTIHKRNGHGTTQNHCAGDHQAVQLISQLPKVAEGTSIHMPVCPPITPEITNHSHRTNSQPFSTQTPANKQLLCETPENSTFSLMFMIILVNFSSIDCCSTLISTSCQYNNQALIRTFTHMSCRSWEIVFAHALRPSFPRLHRWGQYTRPTFPPKPGCFYQALPTSSGHPTNNTWNKSKTRVSQLDGSMCTLKGLP